MLKSNDTQRKFDRGLAIVLALSIIYSLGIYVWGSIVIIQSGKSIDLLSAIFYCSFFGVFILATYLLFRQHLLGAQIFRVIFLLSIPVFSIKEGIYYFFTSGIYFRLGFLNGEFLFQISPLGGSIFGIVFNSPASGFMIDFLAVFLFAYFHHRCREESKVLPNVEV